MTLQDCTLKKIGVVIPTLNGEKELKILLPRVLESRLINDILVIDSSSNDATVQVASSFGVRVKTILRESFNHGLTRELGRKILECDIVIYLTQDAYPVDSETLSKLIQPLLKGEAVVSYGRQLPKPNASFFEKFLRDFNYPEKGEIRSIRDYFKIGSLAFFCSNSCAAYLNKALDEIGGFSKISFGEDTLAAAKLLEKGFSIAYVAEAQVIHSHNVSLIEEFKRYRRMGKERAQHPQYFGRGTSKRGFIFAKTLLKRCPLFYWPYAFVYLAVKGLGFFTSFL